MARNADACVSVDRLPRISSQRPFYTPGFSPALALMHATRIRDFDKSGGPYPSVSAMDTIVSDTGELVWRRSATRQGVVTIDTDKLRNEVTGIRPGASVTGIVAHGELAGGNFQIDAFDGVDRAVVFVQTGDFEISH